MAASPKGITDLRVTLNMVAPDDTFVSRCAKTNLPAFIWERRGDGDPIVEIKVTYDAEDAGADFQKVCLSKNPNENAVFLCYRKGTGSPVIDVKVFAENEAVLEGFAKIDRDINRDGGVRSFVYYKTEAQQKQGRKFNRGDFVDVKDTIQKWCVGRVLELNDDDQSVKVHYEGWSDKWDEWIKISSKRIAPHLTHTKGHYTGPESEKSYKLDGDNLVAFRKCVDSFRKIIEKKDDRTSEDITFLQVDNVRMVQNILNAIIDDPQVIPEAFEFLRMNLRLIVEVFSQPKDINPGFLDSFVRIFDGDAQCRKFYAKYGQDRAKVNKDGKFARMPAEAYTVNTDKESTSTYLIEMINFFGDNNGFEVFLQRLEQSVDPEKMKATPFIVVKQVVKGIFSVRDYLHPEFLAQLVPRLCTPVFERIRKLTDDELKTVDRAALSEVVKHMEWLMMMWKRNADEVAQFMEPFNLEISLRLLTCSILEKRVNGITELRDTIDKVRRRDQPQVAAAGAQRLEVARFITAEMMVKWLVEKEVVEILLVRSPHQELLKRCASILKFLAANNAFSGDHLELLWNSSVDKHESTVRVVYDCLADLANELSFQHLEQLYKRVSATPLDQYKDILLNFLKTFLHVTLARFKNKFFGLDIFWRLIQDSPSVAPDVQKHAFDILVDLLVACESQRTLFLEKCVINLRQCQSVPQALNLAIKICDSYPLDARNIPEKLVFEMETKMQVMRLIFADFNAYVDVAAADAKAKGDTKAQDAKDGKAVGVGGSRFSHADQLDTRLKFLDYVLSHSALTLTPEHIDTLWRVFVVQAVSPDDKDKLYSWLIDNRAARDGRPAFASFPPETASYVFKLLADPTKTDFAKLSVKGYECFQAFFSNANATAQALFFGDDSTRRRVVQYDKLVGLDAFWQIVAKNTNERVNWTANGFLISLYVNLDEKHNKREVYRDFLRRVVAFLAVAHKELAQQKDVQANTDAIIQLVVLVEKFLICIEQGDADEESFDDHASYTKFNPQMRINVTLCDKNGGNKKSASVSIQQASLISSIRAELGRFFGYFPELIQIRYRNRILYGAEYDKLTVADAHIRNNSSLTSFRMERTDRMDRPAEDYQQDACFPRFVLANEKEYFELLFDLLKLGGRVAQEIWKLLDRLPTNQQLANAINSLPQNTPAGSTPDWATVLQSSSLLKLFYSLKIVDRNIRATTPDGDAKQQDAQAWREFFLQHDGFKFLYGVLLNMELDHAFEDVLTQQCLSDLLQMINFFLQGPSRELASKLADTFVVYPSLVSHLLRVLAKVVTVGSDADHAQITQGRLSQEAWLLLIACVQQKPELLQTVYDFGGFNDVIFNGLVETKTQRVRAVFQDGIVKLCAAFDAIPNGPSPRSKLLPQLLAYLPKINTASPNCNEYFDTIRVLLASSKPDSNIFDPAALSADLSKKIVNHPIVEARATDLDSVLRGLLNLTLELVNKVPALKDPLGQQHGLIAELFDKCLFDMPTAQVRGVAPPPKCKSKDTRKAAYALLAELAKGSHANYKALVEKLMPNHDRTHSNGQNLREWDFEPRMEEKSSTGYCGMKNLGCICYMNSLIQQLFMMPQLRKNILAIEEKYLEDDKKESVIYNLQYILAFLQESEKQYCNPKGFVHAFKDWEGNPTNVHIQMDSNEFFSMLMDRIDSKMKGTLHENAVKDVIGGLFSNQFIGRGCDHFKERKEDYYAISVNVKNKKTLEESLEAFVAGEMLEGDNAYMCGQCNKKVDTLKRTCLKTLPNTVIFHLKRFEFDMESMQKVKLNDHLAFPHKINLKPYTVEGLGGVSGKRNVSETDGKAAGNDEVELPDNPDSYYQYELAGIVVHTGSHDRGHYYSFIKERLTPEEKALGKSPQWFEFNDTFVRPFNPDDIPDECFGGEEARSHHRSMFAGEMGSMSMRANMIGPQMAAGGAGAGGAGRETVMQEKYRNAYLLIYDRVEDYAKEMKAREQKELDAASPTAVGAPTSVAPAGSADGKDASTALTEAKTDMPPLKRRASEVRVHVPPKIFKQIWDQNITYWRDRAIFDEDYFQFLYSLLTALKPEQVRELTASPEDFGSLTAELCCKFVFETLARSKIKNGFYVWIQLLTKLLEQSTPACAWMLQHLASPDCNWLQQFLLVCARADIRKPAAELINFAITAVAALEDSKIRDAITAPAVDAKDAKTGPDPSRAICVNLADALIRMLRECPEHWKNFSNYFQVLAHFCNVSRSCAHYAASRHLLGRLVDLYLGDASPNPQIGDIPVDANGKRKRIGDDWNPPDLLHFLHLMKTLVCSHAPPSGAGRPSTTLDWGDSSPLPPLPAPDQALMLNKHFLRQLPGQASTRKRGTHVSDLIVHLCWENAALSSEMIGYIGALLEEMAADDARCLFRPMMAMAQMKDSIADQRVHELMSSLLNIMQLQFKYWKITIICAEHMIRMAKKVPAVYKYLNAQASKWSWLPGYINTYAKQPAANDPNVRMYKEARQPAAWSAAERAGTYNMYPGLGPREKLAALETIRDGKELDTSNASDSDEDLNDRVFTPGQWVDCKDTVHKWVWATVTYAQDDRIGIHFDGWSSKWDEVVARGSTRLQPFLRWTLYTREQQKGNGPEIGDDIGNGKYLTPEQYEQVQSLKAQPKPLSPAQMQQMWEEAMAKRKLEAESGGAAAQLPPALPPPDNRGSGEAGGAMDDD